MAEPSAVSWRTIALPPEHGGWGLLAEPLVLGLVVAPSAAGACVALAMSAAFLCRHPARLAVADAVAGVRHARTGPAALVAVAYGGTALAFGVAALALAGAPLAVFAATVAPVAIAYLVHDVQKRSRDAAAELAGAIALSAGAPAVALAAGWTVWPSLGLGLLMASRSVGAVVEVRCRLRRQRGLSVSTAPVFATHAAFTLAAAVACRAGAIPGFALVVPVAFLARAVWNLHLRPRRLRPQDVGWGEVRAGAAALGAWMLAYGVAS